MWKREVAMEEAMATPMAPPSLCDVLMTPDATPASRSVTPVRAPIETGMKANATPIPATKNGPAKSCQKFPCGGIRVAHRMPVPTSAIPKVMTHLGEVLVTSFWDGPAKAKAVTEVVSQATPVLRAENPSTCCI